MALLLHIESSTTLCSVALSNDNKLIACKEINDGYTHAENLHLFIQALLKEAHIEPKDLNAVSVSKGPGSYTGLRIGVSSAKGLAYALSIPLISVGTLDLMAHTVIKQLCKSGMYYCPMIDARRMEVYTQIFDDQLLACNKTQALIVDEKSIEAFKTYSEITFFGDGMSKCKALLSHLPQAHFVDEILPSARNMPDLAYQKFMRKEFEDVAYFEPYYLKDFLILKKQ